MKACDIMTTPLITADAETSVRDIARFLLDHRISAVPVVDSNRQVIGSVSVDDLFLKEQLVPFSMVPLPALFGQQVDLMLLPQVYECARWHIAADVMNLPGVHVEAESDIGQVAWLMTQRKLKRVIVVHNGRPVGIITRADFARLLT
jgi:CBS domain-containing protein